MIDPLATTTYAQFNEDIVLKALLHDVKKGFYVDVGANYPTIDSVTKIFYDSGWSGINIEPVKSLFLQLQKTRPRDINLLCGAGDKKGELLFREFPKMPGHSTFVLEEQVISANEKLKHKDYKVPVRTLKDIFDEYKVKHIHFLKIDVEGFEYQVVAGNDWAKYRPEVICIESAHDAKEDWRSLLTDNKYRLFITDGLNDYYVAEESWEKRTDNYPERVVMLDYHALKQHQEQSWAKDSSEILRLHQLINDQKTQLQQLDEELRRQSSLSLKNQTWPKRLKRSVYGLTIDWLNYKKSK